MFPLPNILFYPCNAFNEEKKLNVRSANFFVLAVVSISKFDIIALSGTWISLNSYHLKIIPQIDIIVGAIESLSVSKTQSNIATNQILNREQTQRLVNRNK